MAQEPPGRGVFDTLNGPTDVVAFEMGGAAYALVTATEGGVQLVRIHGNGTIEPAGSAVHGSGGFDTLHSPNGADVFEMGGNTYAMVAAGRSPVVQGVQLVRIHGNGTIEPVASAVHGSGGYTLRHAQSVDAFEMGGAAYAAVTSWQGNGAIQLIRIHEDGRLEAAGSAHGGSGGFPRFYGARAADTFEMGNATYVSVVWSYAATGRDSGMLLARVHEDGRLEAVSSATDGTAGFGMLRGADGADAFEVGNATYVAVASGAAGGGIHLVRIHGNGTLEPASSAVHGTRGFDALSGANDVAAFEMGGATYAAVASFGHYVYIDGYDYDDERPMKAGGGVQLVRVHENGTLEAAGSATDGLRGFDVLDSANKVAAFAMGGAAYAMVATWYPDNGIQLARVHENGTLEAVVSATDGSAAAPPFSSPPPPPPPAAAPPSLPPPPRAAFSTLNGPRDVDAFGMGGAAYALVTANEGGVQLVRIHGNGTMEAVSSAVHGSGGFDTLSSANDADVFEVGGSTYAMVAASGHFGIDGVQLVRIHGNGALEAAASARHGSGGYTLRHAHGVAAFEVGNATYAAVGSWHGAGAIQLIRIHEDGRLEAAGSAHGGSGGFPRFYGARAADTFEMGNATYVSVVWSYAATGRDSGMLLARVHEDGRLEAVSSATDSSDGFGMLYNADGADAFKVGNATYVAVASGGAADKKGGMLLVRVHENGALEPAGSAVDGSAGFDTLDGADDVAAFEMGGGTYVAVASWKPDRGVQLIRVHGNGTLEPAGSAVDGSAGFDTLDAATAVDTFKVGGGTYAMAATWYPDNGIQLARIHGNGTLEAVASAIHDPSAAPPPPPPPPPPQGAVVVPPQGAVVVPPPPPPPQGAAFDTLRGLRDVVAFEMGGGTYALAVSEHDNGVQLVRVHGNGTMEASGSAVHGSAGFDTLRSADDADVFRVGGSTYAMVAAGGSFHVNGVQMIRIHESGALEAAGSASRGSGGYALRHPHTVDAFEMGNATYAAVSSWHGAGAIQLFRVHEDGRLEAAGSAHGGSGGFPRFYGARAADAFEMGNSTYVAVVWSYAATNFDSGMLLARVHENGTLEAVSSATDSSDGFGMLSSAAGIDAFEMGGASYAVVASSNEPGILLVRIHGDGRLEPAGSAVDGSGGFDALNGPVDVDTFEMGGGTYAAVASWHGPGSVQLVRIHENGTLKPAGSAVDGSGGFDALDGADAIDAFAMGGNAYAMVASWQPDNGVQLMRVHANGALEAVASATDGDASSMRAPPGGTAPPPQPQQPPPPQPQQPPPPGGTVVLPPGGTVVLPPGGTVSPPPGAVFDTLNGPTDVAAFEMGGNAYALVTATEGGVQLVRVHGNGIIEPAGSAVHGSGGFDTLSQADDADVFEMGGSTYAMVAAGRSFVTQGVQLVRIHEDGRLEPAGSAVHGSGGFTLRHAQGVAAFEMAGETYAAVASWQGHGAIQLIRIHEDGRLEAAGSAHGGSGGFPRFYGARAADTFEMGNATYVSVVWSYAATGRDSGMLLARVHEDGRLEAVSSATDSSDGFGMLYGAGGIDAFEIGGKAYAAVASSGAEAGKGGVLLVRVHGNGTLEPAGSAVHGTRGFDALSGADDVAAFRMGGNTYAAVSSFGHYVWPDDLADLDDFDSEPAKAGGGVQLVRVHENGTLEAVSSATDGARGFDTLDAATAVDAFGMGGAAYAMVATWYPDNGIQLARVHGNGTLEAVASATDGAAARAPLAPPRAVVVAETPGITHITPGPGGTLPRNETGISRAVASVSFAPGTNFTSAGTGEPYAGKLNVTVASGERREAAIGALAGLGGAGAGGRVGIVVEIGDPGADIALSSVAAVWLWNQPPGAALYHMNSTGGITAIPECGSAADPVGWLERTDSTPFCHAAPGAGSGGETGHYTIYTYRLSTFFAAVVPPPPPAAAVPPSTPPPTPTPPAAVVPPPTPTPQPPAAVVPPPQPPADGAAPAPLCSIRLGDASLSLDVSPGDASDPARQTIRNEGSQGLAGVEISASPWYLDPAGDPPYGADVRSLPPSLTELSATGPPSDQFAALLADGTAPSPLAAGLGPGGESGLWLRINLDGRPEQAGTLVQHVTYVAECAPP